MAALSAADKAAVRGVRRSDVELAVSGLRPHLVTSRWLRTNNRYKSDIVKRLKADLPLNAARQQDLADYIAASSILHANDGWSYLGCALSALLQGDAHRALHLAYYAELRAALSLLASDGVGVFNFNHFVLKGGGRTAKLEHGRGTHAAAWDILEFWSGELSSGTLFAKLVRPEARTLDEWFRPHGGGATIAPQAQSWFQMWGMDLSLAHEDQNARNESSYAPDGVGSSWGTSAAEGLEFVSSLWASLKPSPASSFAELDRYILRRSLEGLFKGRNGRAASANDLDYRRLVAATVQSQGFTGTPAKLWEDFLTRRAQPHDPAIFSESAKAIGQTSDDAFSIISRAVLLLRVATGSARDLLQQSGLTAVDLEFWVQDIGTSRGLWDPTDPAPDLRDLWADVDAALGDIRDGASPQSVKGLLLDYGATLPVLTSYERVGLWSLCA